MQFNLEGSFRVQELEVKFKPNRKHSTIDVFSANDVHKFLAPLIANEPREKLLCLSLGGGNGLVGLEVVAKGTSDCALVSPREVLKAPILCNSRAFIVAHNHPSGVVEPSEEDKAIAFRLIQAAEIMDLTMLDFVVVSKFKYYSFAESEPEFKISAKGGKK